VYAHDCFDVYVTTFQKLATCSIEKATKVIQDINEEWSQVMKEIDTVRQAGSEDSKRCVLSASTSHYLQCFGHTDSAVL
jgi:hypothetical protein